jgi:hypothetical protein
MTRGSSKNIFMAGSQALASISLNPMRKSPGQTQNDKCKRGSIVPDYRFCDSFCFHLRFSELLGTEMPRLIERLKTLHGETISVSDLRFTGKVR